MYRFQKFARKHKPALATASAIAACLILGTTVSAWQAVRATTAETQANANEAQAKEKAQEALAQRDEIQRQRDEVKSLAERLQKTLYAAHMNLAQHAWDENVTSRTLELLEQYRPKPGESDMRGFEWRYLYRLSHAEALTIKASDTFLRRVAYSSDGKRLLTDDRGGTAKVWDAQTGVELLNPNQKPLNGTIYSPNDKYVAGSSWNGMTNESTVRIWDVHTGDELHNIKTQAGSITEMAFSPDSKRLASVSARWYDKENKYVPGALKIWDAATGQEIVSVEIGGLGLAFAPDGKRLAVASSDSIIKVCDTESGNELMSIEGGDDKVAYSPDGKHLAGASSHPDEGWVVKIWDAATGHVLRTLRGHSGRQINHVAFSPDGKCLASAGGDRTAKVWDVESGAELFAFKGHTNMVQRVAFSPDGARLASASLDGTVRVWDVVGTLPGRAFSRRSNRIYSVAFSPDGNRIATAGSTGVEDKQTEVKGELKVWNSKTGEELTECKGHHAVVRKVVFTSDGKRLASLSEDKTLKVWDAETGHELFSHEIQIGRVPTLAFSADGKFVASASDFTTIKVWDNETGREVLSLQHTKPVTGETIIGIGPPLVTGLSFSPDGKRLVTISREAMKLWDVQTGEAVSTMQGMGTAMASGVAFSPDGTRIANSKNVGPGGVGEIIVRDAQSGLELLTLKGHTASIGGIVFSPDGKRLASGSGNPTGGTSGEVKVWDAESGQELLTITGGGYGHHVAFSPDGNWLASCARGALKLYDATPLPEKP